MKTFDQQIQHLIKEAILEDVGDGDHSTICCVSPNKKGKAVLKIKEDGILAGIEVAKKIFNTIDPSSKIIVHKQDGASMKNGEIAFEVEAAVHTILKAERLVLNCMQRMSGIATLTRQYVDKLNGYHTKVLDTRKTTPNFRLPEKEAVRIGGGVNHRFGLYDMIMLKDNHIDFCGGIDKAINKAFEYVQTQKPGLKIEVETRNLQDVKIVCEMGAAKVFRIMLDNFTPQQVQEALKMIAGKFETEASGGINLETVESFAKTGVDYVSVGGLIHQARSLDLSLKAEVG